MPEVDYLGEGASDLVVARKLIELAGASVGRSYFRPGSGTGKLNLDGRLSGLNAGAAHGRLVLVLRDLDRDAPCAGDLVSRLLPSRNANLLLRIAVRSVEAWYVADREAYARYCGVRAGRLPSAPEQVPFLKNQLVQLADAGMARKLRAHLVETTGGVFPIGRPSAAGMPILSEAIGARRGPLRRAGHPASNGRCVG